MMTIQQTQQKLNWLYDTFTDKYGLLNSRANSLAFSDDSSYYLLCSLEILNENGELERKADIFTKRTIKPHEVVNSVDTASEALALSISEKACVDMPYMAQLSGKSQDELIDELNGVIFLDPVRGNWQTETNTSPAMSAKSCGRRSSRRGRTRLRSQRRGAAASAAERFGCVGDRSAPRRDVDRLNGISSSLWSRPFILRTTGRTRFK